MSEEFEAKCAEVRKGLDQLRTALENAEQIGIRPYNVLADALTHRGIDLTDRRTPAVCALAEQLTTDVVAELDAQPHDVAAWKLVLSNGGETAEIELGSTLGSFSLAWHDNLLLNLLDDGPAERAGLLAELCDQCDQPIDGGWKFHPTPSEKIHPSCEHLYFGYDSPEDYEHANLVEEVA